MKKLSRITLFLILLPILGLNAQNPLMVENIYSHPNSSTPMEAAEFNGKLYFSGNNVQYGRELFEFDAALPQGSQLSLVADLGPGTAGSNPEYLTVFNGNLYFAATADQATGRELFMYDGINPPALVANINTSTAQGISSSTPAELTVFNNKLYFRASSTSNDMELWEYDGVNAPVRTADIHPAGGSYPNQLTVYNNALYFSASDGSNSGRRALWKYDGSNPPVEIQGTSAPTPQPTDEVNHLIAFGGKLVFSFNGGNGTGVELWSYDGTNVTQVGDLNPGNGNSWPAEMTEYNGALYFRANSPSAGLELFEYDGVNAPGLAADIEMGLGSSWPSGFMVYNGKLYFSANNGLFGDELFVFDGSNATMAADINPFAGGFSYKPRNLAVYNSQLYLAGFDGTDAFGVELMAYDGVNAPQYVADAFLGDGSAEVKELIEFNGDIYFVATTFSKGAELWKYDGTTASLFADINPGSAHSNPASLVIFNNLLHFVATDPANGREIFATDGVNPPAVAADIELGTQGSDPLELTEVNNVLFFSAVSAAAGRELWRYDGSNPASMVADLDPGTNGFQPENLLAFNNELYFTQRNVDKLWKYSGSGMPTILPNADYHHPFEFKVFNNAIYFTAESVMPMGNVMQLWKTDGNSAPVVAINDIGGLSSLGIFNNQLVFDGMNISNQAFLYLYDGVNPPTPINKNGFVQARGYTVHDDTLYFAGSNSSNFELWRYADGSLPTMVADINPGQGNSFPSSMLSFGTGLFFSADNGLNGRELWVLDPANPVGVEADNIAENISLYPNPVQDLLRLSMPELSILQTSVIDMTGKTWNGIGYINGAFDVSQLPQGIYFLRIETEQGEFKKKFVKL